MITSYGEYSMTLKRSIDTSDRNGSAFATELFIANVSAAAYKAYTLAMSEGMTPEAMAASIGWPVDKFREALHPTRDVKLGQLAVLFYAMGTTIDITITPTIFPSEVQTTVEENIQDIFSRLTMCVVEAKVSPGELLYNASVNREESLRLAIDALTTPLKDNQE
jgi:hypothetical protein